MRAHLILSTLLAVGLFGGAALAEKNDDHASKEKPTKEHFAREHSVRDARTPERMERARTHGDVDRVTRASSHKVDRATAEKAKLQIERITESKAASRRNCSYEGEECRSSRSSSSTSSRAESNRTVGLSGPNAGWIAQEREKMREKYLEAMMKSMAMKKEGAAGK